MYKSFFLLLALIALFGSSYAQKTQAIIVFANNDSLSAEVRDEKLNLIQGRIYYRQPGSNAFSKGLPEQIKTVKFADGRLLESVKTDSAQFLLLCLIEGYYNLYRKVEAKGLNTYYIRHAMDTSIHLYETFQDKYEEVDGEIRRISNYEYAHQLTMAMADNARLTVKISDVKFKENELIAIIKEYNEFKGYKYSEAESFNQKPTKVNMGVFINSYPFKTFFNETGFGTGIGMSFDFYKNRPYERLGLKTSISLNVLDYKKDENYNLMMEIPLALSFTFLDHNRLKMNVFGGISSLFILDSYMSYDTRQTNTFITPCPYLGAGIDYKIKKSALRLELSLFTKSFMIGYIF
jgi:hypothetical protein